MIDKVEYWKNLFGRQLCSVGKSNYHLEKTPDNYLYSFSNEKVSK